MKVKAAAGALGAPGWGDEGCCEPRLYAVTPPPRRSPSRNFALRSPGAESGSALSAFGQGGKRVCAVPPVPPSE